MSRPILHPWSHSTPVKIDVPPGWSTTVTAISCSGYHQLLRIRYPSGDGDEKNTRMFVSTQWKNVNDVMESVEDQSQSMALSPFENTVQLELDFFFSKVHHDAAKDLADKSGLGVAGVHEVVANRPSYITKMPDCMTVTLMVQDDEEDPIHKHHDMIVVVHLQHARPVAGSPAGYLLPKSRNFSYRDAMARHLLREIVEHPPLLGGEPANVEPTTDPIAIIGAGAAGLYAAMILQDLQFPIPIRIIEADPHRIGGRLFTYKFSQTEYDYVDIGAMRFPSIPWMHRVFKLFDDLHVDRFPFLMSSENAHLYYNGTRFPATKRQIGHDVFNVSTTCGGIVPPSFILDVPPTTPQNSQVDYWFNEVIEPLKAPFYKLNDDTPNTPKFRSDFKSAWEQLVSLDSRSTRSLLLSLLPGPPYPEAVVEWLETYLSASGLFDEALVETVMDSLDFGWPSPSRAGGVAEASGSNEDIPWYGIKGGSYALVEKMHDHIPTIPIDQGQRVTDIKLISKTTGAMNVTSIDSHGCSTTNKYSQVICTTSLGCLQAIDTSTLDLSYQKKAAIRSVQYDASTKVAIKFPTRWWQKGPKPINGGASSTDLPIRTIVYPSYGTDTSPGVLLASYTWAQDARRLGSIANGFLQPVDVSDPLVQLTLDNLAAVHGISKEEMGTPIAAYSHTWFDPHTRGAFALFGPGEFGQTQAGGKGLLASLKAPNGYGTFHIAGEATSVHHAWLLGSLNSAWRAVYNLLKLAQPSLIPILEEKYGIPDEDEVEILDRLHDHALHWRI